MASLCRIARLNRVKNVGYAHIRTLSNFAPILHKISYHDAEKYTKNIRILQASDAIVSRMIHTSTVTRKDTSSEDSGDLRQPLQYSGSKASQYDSIETFAPKRKARPKWEHTSVLISTVSFLIYWGVLREENDWDEMLYDTERMYTQVPGLEENQLQAAITYNKNAGLSTDEMKTKLEEVRAKRKELEKNS